MQKQNNNQFFLRKVPILLLSIFILLSLIQSIILFPATEGDTYIHYVFARNIAQGHWFQYNTGELSTGSTSPLWTVILGGLYRIGGGDNITLWSKILSIIFLLGTIPLVYLITQHLFLNPKVSLLASLFWAVNPFAAYWAASAMETLFFIFLVLLSALLFEKVIKYKFEKRWRTICLGFVLGLTSLTRPEGIIASLIILALIFIKIFRLQTPAFKKVKILTNLFLPLIVIISPYYIFIYLNFQTIFTSSSISRLLSARKVAFQTLGIYWTPKVFFSLGKYYFAFLIPFVFGFLKLIQGRDLVKSDNLQFFSLIWLLFHFSFFTFIMPDIYVLRYTLPMMPFYFITCALGIKLLFDIFYKKRSRIFLIFVIIFIFITLSENLFLLKKRYLQAKESPVNVMYNTGTWLKDNTPENSLIAAGEVQVAYYSGRKVLSLDGIIDGKATPYRKAKSNMLPFLERYKPDYILGQFIPRFWQDTIFLRLVQDESGEYKIGSKLNIDRLEFTLVHIDEEEKIPVYKIDYTKEQG